MILPRRGGYYAPTSPPASEGVLMLLLGRAASRHGVGAEVPAPAIAPLPATKGIGTSYSALRREGSLCNLKCFLKPHGC